MLNSILIALRLLIAISSLPAWKVLMVNKSEGCTRVESFLLMSLTQALRGNRLSLRSGSSVHIGLFVPLRRKSLMTMTHLFFAFYMEAVFTQGVGWLNLSDTSNLDEPSFSSLFSCTCRALYLLCQCTWEGGVVMEEMLRCAGQEVVTISPHPLSHGVLQIKDRIGNSLYHASSQVCPWEGRAFLK